MPDLDVSDVLFDPMLSDACDVVRRSGRVTSRGRSDPVQYERFRGVDCVVTQDDGNGLERTPDGQRAPRRIRWFGTMPLYGPVIEPVVSGGAQVTLPQPPLGVPHQPDLIVWQGTCYIVTEVLPYSTYGAGVYEVRAESTTMPDVPQ
jgi:hypothetical protein